MLGSLLGSARVEKPMANQINRLTARMVATITKKGLHADGGNLYLDVKDTGARSWAFIYRSGGKQRQLGLGSAGPGGVSLADARQKAAEARRSLQDGVDPMAARKQTEAARKVAETTFGQFADSYVADHRAGWSNPKHAAQWAMTLGDAYCKVIRTKPVAEIGIDEVLAVLKPVWQKRPETARRIRMRLERVLDAAKVVGLRTGENPARWRGNLDHLLPVHGKATKSHHAAMPFAEVPAFMADLAERPSTAALALRLLILTATRTSETLLAEWQEFDIEKKMWTIPKERMKSRRAHRIPLSDEALAVIAKAQGMHPRFVFPGPAGKGPLSNMAFAALLGRMGRDEVTPHGFRSAFRDWSAECTSFPNEVCEMALAHVIENAAEAAYRRGDLLEKRKQLMDAWATYLSRPSGQNVVTFKADAS